jgi:hypothetical protein
MGNVRRWFAVRCLVLAAMLAQACVAFGHVHLSAADRVKPDAVAPPATSLRPHAQPASSPPGDQDGGCVICWAVGIGGATLVQEPHAAAWPDTIWAFRAGLADRVGPAAGVSAFDARGPPCCGPQACQGT